MAGLFLRQGYLLYGYNSSIAHQHLVSELHSFFNWNLAADAPFIYLQRFDIAWYVIIHPRFVVEALGGPRTLMVLPNTHTHTHKVVVVD